MQMHALAGKQPLRISIVALLLREADALGYQVVPQHLCKCVRICICGMYACGPYFIPHVCHVVPQHL